MMTSVSSNSGCCSSYSMFTSHLPAFSDGQQLTVHGGGGEEGEREEGEGEGEERERGRRGRGDTSLTHKHTLSYIMTIT